MLEGCLWDGVLWVGLSWLCGEMCQLSHLEVNEPLGQMNSSKTSLSFNRTLGEFGFHIFSGQPHLMCNI